MKIIFYIFWGFLMNQTSFASNLSHGGSETLDIEVHIERLKKQPNLTLPLEDEIDLLKQVSQFDLGRFLLERKGLNGYWTSYIILKGPKLQNLSPLEEWILRKCPAVRATQERFLIFKDYLQKNLKPGSTLCSVPCGLMDDLLSLDYSKTPHVTRIGIDIDQESLDMAQENSKSYELSATFVNQDAWRLDFENTFDVLTSNGLNIYEPDEVKVTALYQKFYDALKPGGILITSFLTPPPQLSPKSPWKNFSPLSTQKQKAIFGDILQVAWQVFRTEAETRKQLEDAGFEIVETLYDSQGMFPTIIGKKR
jgi:ubiquinone/menaquinone biosynthesis C-methylase UbiE